MVKKTITYEDFNGEKRTEDHLFNLTKSEIVEWESSIEGGMSSWLERVASGKKVPEIIATVKEFILRSYGEKSPDGRRFCKSNERSNAFYETPAYDVMFMEFMEDPNKFVDFIKAVMPPTEVKK